MNSFQFKNKVYLIENHHQAYFLWEKNHIKNTVLVHIDAHIDYQRNDLSLIKNEHINIGNYIYPAIKKGIVNSFYWIIPGNKQNFPYNMLAIKKILLELQAFEKISCLKYLDGMVILNLGLTKLYICVLDTLPKIIKPVLLDIDVDYFINKSLYGAKNVDNISNKKQWLSVNLFVKKIRNKLHNIAFTTIAYSTNEGWTPMKYRLIGDELANKIGSNDKNTLLRILASNNLKKFRNLLDQDKFKESKKYYVIISRLYGNTLMTDINYVFLYLEKNQIDLAFKEIRKFLKIDPKNGLYLMQLGIIYLKLNKLFLASKYIQKGLSFKPIKNTCVLYLTYIEIKQNHWEKAKQILKLFDQRQINSLYYFLYGLICLHFKDSKNKKIFRDLIEIPMNFSIPVGMDDIYIFLHNYLLNK